MSFWAEDPELFLHKGKDGVVHMLRCKKETMALSSMSMLMKPEDLTDEGTITDHRSLTGGCYDWDKDKYEALIDYIYPKHLMVNCHGSVIGELATREEKSLLFFVNYEKLVLVLFTLIFMFVQLVFNLFYGDSVVLFTLIILFLQLLFNRFHLNKKATVVLYIRALDILDMGTYGFGADHPDRAVPARMVKYLQNGMVAHTEPNPREMKLSKEVETLQQELLSSKEKMEVEVAKGIKLTEELTIKNKEVETAQQELLLAKEKIQVELTKEIKLAEELVIKSKEVETLKRERLFKENIFRIYTKAATHCSLTIRNGNVIVGYNKDSDDCQYWVKDDMYGAIVKDKWSYPSYALVNKFTGQALKAGEDKKSVELVRYNPNVLDESILWLEVDLGDGYKAIRKAADPRMNFDGFSGIVEDGTIVVLWDWGNGDNQKWNMVRHT